MAWVFGVFPTKGDSPIMFCIRPKIWHPISKHSHRICLEHQHGRHDVIWKRSIAEMDLQKTKEVYKSFWPEKVDHGVLVAPLCYFSLLLVVSAERCSPTYKLPLKEKQRRKIFGWPLVAFKKVKWRTTRKCIVHERTPFPALGLFSRAACSWQGGLLQLFPRFQQVTLFYRLVLATPYLRITNQISDQSNVF